RHSATVIRAFLIYFVLLHAHGLPSSTRFPYTTLFRSYQRGKFGFEGELFQKRKELVKPIQDQIYKAVEEVAKQGLYAVIFDRTSELIMLYADERFDKSDDVLKALGLNPGEFVQ